MGGKEPIFIHTPKVGGNYVGATVKGIKYDGNHFVFMNKLGGASFNNPPKPFYIKRWFNFGQSPIERTKNRICIASVRNPFDWLVSFWHVVPMGKGSTSFDYFVRTIAEYTDTWPSKHLIFFPLFTNLGDFLPDIIIRQDRLHEDLVWLANEFDGITYKPRDRVKVSQKREFKDHRRYYSTELADVVYNTWGLELNLYGYNFDGLTIGAIDRKVHPSIKKHLKYYWTDDELVFIEVK